MKDYGQYCALANALGVVGERWTLLVIRELLTGPKRFSDLVAGLPGIATNLLTARLEELEASGLVERKTQPPPAPAVLYQLTSAGAALEESVHALVRWGGRFMAKRSKGQTFRVEWLAIALQALVRNHTRNVLPLAVAVETAEGRTHLNFKNGRFEIAPAETATEVSLSGPAETILGWASGKLSRKAATAAGLQVKGPAKKIAILRRIFAGAKTPSKEVGEYAV